MRKKKPGLSLGSILTLCLTAVVTVGCVFVFGRIRNPSVSGAMEARKVIGAVQSFMQGETQPQATVRTVTFTLAPTSAPTPAPAPTPALYTPDPQKKTYAPHSFSLTAGGLLAFQSDICDSVYNKTDKTLDLMPVVNTIRNKISADLNLLALPQTINTADRKYSDTMAPVEAASAIRAMRVDHVILGTEHLLDQGTDGAEATVSALRNQNVVGVGDASQPCMVQINGGAVAILSYTDVLTTRGKNALASSPGYLTLYSEDVARQQIQQARNQGARCVIVYMYWGKLDTASVTTAQKNTARALAAMGADVILGIRSSRVLPMELIRVNDEAGKQRTAFVAYSLGTLLTESREGVDISGALLHLNLRSDENGEMHFEGIEYTPTYIWRQSVAGKIQYRLICSADSAPEYMSDQQKDVMARALKRIQNALKDSPVKQRK